MKFLILLIFIFLSSCTPSKKVYMCGEYVCKDKREFNAYFKENISIEVFNTKKEESEEVDLVNINLNKKTTLKKSKNKVFDVIKAKKEEKRIREVALKKKELDNKKKIIIKNNKSFNNKEKKIVTKKRIVKKKMLRTDINPRCPVIEDCDIDKVTNEILKTSKKKDFPNITIK